MLIKLYTFCHICLSLFFLLLWTIWQSCRHDDTQVLLQDINPENKTIAALPQYHYILDKSVFTQFYTKYTMQVNFIQNKYFIMSFLFFSFFSYLRRNNHCLCCYFFQGRMVPSFIFWSFCSVLLFMTLWDWFWFLVFGLASRLIVCRVL